MSVDIFGEFGERGRDGKDGPGLDFPKWFPQTILDSIRKEEHCRFFFDSPKDIYKRGGKAVGWKSKVNFDSNNAICIVGKVQDIIKSEVVFYMPLLRNLYKEPYATLGTMEDSFSVVCLTFRISEASTATGEQCIFSTKNEARGLYINPKKESLQIYGSMTTTTPIPYQINIWTTFYIEFYDSPPKCRFVSRDEDNRVTTGEMELVPVRDIFPGIYIGAKGNGTCFFEGHLAGFELLTHENGGEFPNAFQKILIDDQHLRIDSVAV